MKQFLMIAFGGAAAMALVITFALGRSPPAPVVAAPNRIEDVRNIPLKKADRFHTATLAEEPKPVETVRVLPDAPGKVPPVVSVREDDGEERPAARRRHRGRDICSRHNMRKVTTRGGRSWRCRR